VRRCRPWEQTADDDDADDVIDNNDQGARADVDEPSSYPAPEIATCDYPHDVTVATDNADAPDVKRFDAPTASDAAVVSLIMMRVLKQILSLRREINVRKVKSFPEPYMAHRASLISVSIVFNQTLAYTFETMPEF